MEENKLSVPIGYVFKPSDTVLIFYLHCKTINSPFRNLHDHIIPECNLYASQEPWEIWDSFDGRSRETHGADLYFFTQFKEITLDRRVGTGKWQVEDGGTPIVEENSNQVIGSKKRFRYENKESEEDGKWIMYEYTLDPSLLHADRLNDYVLCCLIKKYPFDLKKQKKKRKLQVSQAAPSAISSNLREPRTK